MNRNASHLQELESRRFLSAAIELGSLVVRGTVNNDTVVVSLNNGTGKIDVAVNSDPVESFDPADFSRIVVRTYTGDDTTIVDGVAKPTFVFSGLGDDHITTGSERDLIYSDAGNDVIDAGNGINLVDAGDGNDSIVGGNAVDAIYGGLGNDTIFGGDGNDLLAGSNGADSINGGNGNDRIYGGKHNDILIGGAGNDTIWGQAGDDNIDGGEGNDIVGGVLGTNTLTGGAGSDTFYVRTSLSGQTNDFDSATDILKTLPSE